MRDLYPVRGTGRPGASQAPPADRRGAARRRRARWVPWGLAALVAALAPFGAHIVFRNELTVGDPAPDFALAGSDGRTHALADHLGKRVVVLAWFPKAFTAG